jgi:hypothetical protein
MVVAYALYYYNILYTNDHVHIYLYVYILVYYIIIIIMLYRTTVTATAFWTHSSVNILYVSHAVCTHTRRISGYAQVNAHGVISIPIILFYII